MISAEWLSWFLFLLLQLRKSFNKKYWSWSLPNWTCCHVIISQEMTGISGALALFGAQTSVWVEASLDSMSSLWHQTFLTGFGSYVKTSIQYICQWVSSLNLAGLHFRLPSLAASFPFLRLPPFFFFFTFFLHFFSPFSWSPPPWAKDPAFSHRVCCWRLGHCFLLQGNGEGGREEADWLPGCQLWLYVSVRKSRGDRCDDDRGTVHPRDWFQLENVGFLLYFSDSSA